MASLPSTERALRNHPVRWSGAPLPARESRSREPDPGIRAARNRRGSTKRSSRPLASVRRACVCAATGVIRGRHQQAPGHAQVNDPLGGRLCRWAFTELGARRTQFADDVLSGAVDGQDDPALQPARLSPGRGFEGLTMGGEPDIYDPITVDPGVDTAGNCLHFRQFWHDSDFIGIATGLPARLRILPIRSWSPQIRSWSPKPWGAVRGPDPLVWCVMQIADYLSAGQQRHLLLPPPAGAGPTKFTRSPQACAWGYHLAPASRALHLVLA